MDVRRYDRPGARMASTDDAMEAQPCCQVFNSGEKRGQVQLLTIRLDLVRSEDAQNSSQRPRWIGLPRD